MEGVARVALHRLGEHGRLRGRGGALRPLSLSGGVCPDLDYTQRQELRKGMVSWLISYSWDYFLTVTFRDPRPPHLALNVLNQIRRTLRPAKPPLLFLGTEQHASSLLHVHGLMMAGTPALSAQGVWKLLYERFGRSKVDGVLDQQKVSMYVTKYVTKELGEWGIW